MEASDLAARGPAAAADPAGPDPRGRRRSGLLGSAWLAALLTAVVVGVAVLVGFTAYDALTPTPDIRPEVSQLTDGERATSSASTATGP